MNNKDGRMEEEPLTGRKERLADMWQVRVSFVCTSFGRKDTLVT